MWNIPNAQISIEYQIGLCCGHSNNNLRGSRPFNEYCQLPNCIIPRTYTHTHSLSGNNVVSKSKWRKRIVKRGNTNILRGTLKEREKKESAATKAAVAI